MKETKKNFSKQSLINKESDTIAKSFELSEKKTLPTDFAYLISDARTSLQSSRDRHNWDSRRHIQGV